MPKTNRVSRREFLLAASSATLAFGHGTIGPLRPPLPVPDASLLWSDGARRGLSSVLTNHVTAIQWIFTNCQATCPMQGAIFQRTQKLMPGHAERGIQLLTLSVDPDHDSPKQLAAWLKTFHAGSGWHAGTPAKADLPHLQSSFGQSSSAVDNHSTQVFLVDRKGAFVWRTPELPDPASIAELLEKMVRL